MFKIGDRVRMNPLIPPNNFWSFETQQAIIKNLAGTITKISSLTIVVIWDTFPNEERCFSDTQLIMATDSKPKKKIKAWRF